MFGCQSDHLETFLAHEEQAGDEREKELLVVEKAVVAVDAQVGNA